MTAFNDEALTAPDATPELGGANAVARRSFHLLFANVVSAAGFLVGTLVLARSLGPSGRGVIAFFTVSALIGSRLVGMGVTDATAVLAARWPERRATVLGTTVGVTLVQGVVGGGLVAGALALMHGFISREITTTVLLALAGGIAANTLTGTAAGYLRGCGRLTSLAVITASLGWTYAVGYIALWLVSGLTVLSAALAWVGFSLVISIAALATAVRVGGIAAVDLPIAREALSFGRRAWVGSFAELMNARADQVIMGYITTTTVLGYYAIAVNVAEVLLYLPYATSTALLPSVLRARRDLVAAQTLVVFRRLLLLTSASSLAALAIGAPLIPVLYGAAFDHSVVPFVLLVPGAIGFAALTVFETALLAIGSPGRASASMAVALVVGVVLDFALVPRFAADGAAAAATAAFFASGLAAIVLFHRRNPFPWREAVPGGSDVRAMFDLARSASVRFWDSRRGPGDAGLTPPPAVGEADNHLEGRSGRGSDPLDLPATRR